MSKIIKNLINKNVLDKMFGVGVSGVVTYGLFRHHQMENKFVQREAELKAREFGIPQENSTPFMHKIRGGK